VRYNGHMKAAAGIWVVLTLAGAAWGQSVTSVTNVIAYAPGLSPGSRATVTGSGFGTSVAIPVTVGGKTARVIAVSGQALNIVIPDDAPLGATNLQVGSGAAFPLTLVRYSPAIVTVDGAAGGLVMATTALALNPAKPGDSVSFYAVGLGPLNGSAAATLPAVTVGGATATVQSAVAFLLPGEFVVTITVPPATGATNQPIILTAGGVASNTALIPVAITPTVSAVVNTASFAPGMPIAPGSVASLFGTGFGSKDNLYGFPFTSINGVSVTFNGVAAPLVHLVASAGQIDLVVPVETPETGTALVAVTAAGETSALFSVNMAASAPGVFQPYRTVATPTRHQAAVLFANTAWLVMPESWVAEYGLPGGCRSSGIDVRFTCAEVARRGDYIQIYLTGLGKATPGGDPAGTPLETGGSAPADGSILYRTVETPSVTIGGIPAVVLYSGLAPGFAGLYQINLQIPASVPAGDAVPVEILAANGQSDTATTIAIAQ
jgi:uncharacterized protein (TIGR03437 family)